MASAILSLLAEDYRALVLAPETLCVQLQTRCLLIDEIKYEYMYIYIYLYIYMIYIYEYSNVHDIIVHSCAIPVIFHDIQL